MNKTMAVALCKTNNEAEEGKKPFHLKSTLLPRIHTYEN